MHQKVARAVPMAQILRTRRDTAAITMFSSGDARPAEKEAIIADRQAPTACPDRPTSVTFIPA
jgi:hypothetical protein